MAVQVIDSFGNPVHRECKFHGNMTGAHFTDTYGTGIFDHESGASQAQATALGFTIGHYWGARGIDADDQYLFCVDPFFNGHYKTVIHRFTLVEKPDHYYFDLSGSWEIKADTDLWYDGIIPADAELIESVNWPNVDGGILSGDGCEATEIDFFEMLRPGGKWSASMTVYGVTLKVEFTITTAMRSMVGRIETYGYRATVVPFQSCANGGGGRATSDTCSIELKFNGVNLGQNYQAHGKVCNPGLDCSIRFVECWADVSNGASLTVAEGGTNIHTGPGGDNTSRVVYSALPPFEYVLDARMRAWGGAYPDTVTLKWQSHQEYDPDSGVYLPATQDVTLNPNSGSVTRKQIYFSFALYGGVPPDENGGLVRIYNLVIDEICSVRAWLSSTSLATNRDDTNDQRIQWRGFYYDAMTMAQASSQAVSTSHALTHSAASIATTYANWEGYRYLSVPATLTAGTNGQKFLLGIQGRVYEITMGNVGDTVTRIVDLCDPKTIPIKVDKRHSRFPLITFGDVPDFDGQPDEQKGYMFGPFTVGSVSVGGIGTTDTVTMGPLALVQQDVTQITFLAGFKCEFLGWPSDTDHTYIHPFNLNYCDGRLCDFGHMAHVVPTTGDPPYYRPFGVYELAAFIAGVPGYTTALLTDLDAFHNSGMHAFHLAGNGATKRSGTWDYWIDKTLSGTLTVPFQLQIDILQTVPLLGNVWDRDAFPTSGSMALPCNTAKFMRAQAWGLVFHEDGSVFNGADIRTYDTLVPANAEGTGTADARARYLTGTPFPRGNVDTTIECHEGPTPYLKDSLRTHDRFRVRTSFRTGGAPSDVFHMCFSPANLLHTLYKTDAGLQCFTHNFDGVAVLQTVSTEADIDWANICFSADGFVVVLYTVSTSGDSDIRYTWSANGTGVWSTAIKPLAGKTPALTIHPTSGTEWAAIFDDGAGHWTLWKRNREDSTFSSVGTIASAASGGHGALEVSHDTEYRLVFVYDDGGTVKRATSPNGGGVWDNGTIASGSRPCLALSREGRSEFYAIYDGANWNLHRMMDIESAVIDSAGLIVAGPDKPGGLEVGSEADHRLVFMLFDGTDAVKRYTTLNNGGTWDAE